MYNGKSVQKWREGQPHMGATAHSVTVPNNLTGWGEAHKIWGTHPVGYEPAPRFPPAGSLTPWGSRSCRQAPAVPSGPFPLHRTQRLRTTFSKPHPGSGSRRCPGHRRAEAAAPTCMSRAGVSWEPSKHLLLPPVQDPVNLQALK